ncbi:MAG: hypothetical protein OEW90_20440 [Betaproteobacteria bacterium]|nr:hypothetical protein [Betaproteobacteria bacterium]
MGKFSLQVPRRLSSLVVLLLLAACGGGGGSDGNPSPDPVVYNGNANVAVVTATNAPRLTGDLFDSDATFTTIAGVSVESGAETQNRGSGLTDLARRLSRIFRDGPASAEQASSAQRLVAGLIPIDRTEPCDFNTGSIRESGTLNDDNTGTLEVSFNSCLIDGVTLNGPATLRVDAVASPFPAPLDFTLSFARLTLRGPGLSIDAGGTLRTQVTSPPDTETITINLVSLNNSTSETGKTENLVFVDVYVNTFIGTPVTSNVSGRVFDHVHGYVDVTTPVLLVFNTQTQLFPDSGQVLLTGGQNSSVLATALSATSVKLDVDLDGVGGFDSSVTLNWTDL